MSTTTASGLRPTLYVADNPESQKAVKMLSDAGFEVEVKQAPSGYQAAYGLPVLFAFSTTFEGLDGVSIFIENARILGYRRPSAD